MTINTQIYVEYTDTFSGEANYSWCKRKTIDKGNKEFSDLSMIREAKKALGLNGVRCKKVDMGETIALYPYGTCTVIFVWCHYFGNASN